MSNDTSPKKTPQKKAPSRDDRLKAALKANLARRKSQAKARAGVSPEQNKSGDQEG